jgi:acyl carrier protein
MMEKTQTIFETVVQIAQSKCKGFDASTLRLDKTSLKSLGLDSLNTIRLVSGIEDEFRIEIAEAEVFRTSSVHDLVGLIRQKLEK